jgi:hypothetical protein
LTARDLVYTFIEDQAIKADWIISVIMGVFLATTVFLVNKESTLL